MPGLRRVSKLRCEEEGASADAPTRAWTAERRVQGDDEVASIAGNWRRRKGGGRQTVTSIGPVLRLGERRSEVVEVALGTKCGKGCRAVMMDGVGRVSRRSSDAGQPVPGAGSILDEVTSATRTMLRIPRVRNGRLAGFSLPPRPPLGRGVVVGDGPTIASSNHSATSVTTIITNRRQRPPWCPLVSVSC